jgi:hypothetical protein
MCAILCLFVEPVLASLLCIATRAIVRYHLYLLSSFSELLCLIISTVCVFVGLVIRSALGLIYGVVRIPYLQLHHILLVCQVIALIPSVFTSSHQCIGRLSDLVSIAIPLGMVRFTFSCQF